jgi:hypothetical protein
MSSRNLTRSIAAGAVAIAVAIGGYAIANPNSNDNSSGTADAAPQTQSNPGPRARPNGGPQAPSDQTPIGQVPKNWTPGSGTIITGAAADKAKAAAVAKYPDGVVNRVLKLSDGSYAVHRIQTPAPHHVFVSKDFQVTGAE